MMMILLKQLVRTRTDINLRRSESMRCYTIFNRLASQLAIAIISRGNIASHTNGIKLSFRRFLKSTKKQSNDNLIPFVCEAIFPLEIIAIANWLAS